MLQCIAVTSQWCSDRETSPVSSGAVNVRNHKRAVVQYIAVTLQWCSDRETSQELLPLDGDARE